MRIHRELLRLVVNFTVIARLAQNTITGVRKNNNNALLNKMNKKQLSLTNMHHAIYHRDNKNMVPEDTPVPEEVENQGDTLFSFGTV
jgi:hypothetical protein